VAYRSMGFRAVSAVSLNGFLNDKDPASTTNRKVNDNQKNSTPIIRAFVIAMTAVATPVLVNEVRLIQHKQSVAYQGLCWRRASVRSSGFAISAIRMALEQVSQFCSV
jgi:hypothetical protein